MHTNSIEKQPEQIYNELVSVLDNMDQLTLLPTVTKITMLTEKNDVYRGLQI